MEIMNSIQTNDTVEYGKDLLGFGVVASGHEEILSCGTPLCSSDLTVSCRRLTIGSGSRTATLGWVEWSRVVSCQPKTEALEIFFQCA